MMLEKHCMPKFGINDVEILSEVEAYKGIYTLKNYQLRHRLFAGGWGQHVQRELDCRIPAVAV